MALLNSRLLSSRAPGTSTLAARPPISSRPSSAGEGGERETLLDILNEDADFSMVLGDLATYRNFRHQEPQLVSIVDGKPDLAGQLEAMVIRHKGQPLGALSFLVQENRHKPPPANKFGRIDIVIVPSQSQGIGLGRFLLLCGNLLLLRNHKSQLYSISCLAAHPAVAAVLEQSGYSAERREKEQFVHEELRLVEGGWRNMERDFTTLAVQSFQRLRYTLRQRKRNA